MGKRMDRLCFPHGKAKALTLSYDDGVVQDRRLVGILNRYGLKCTFNIGSGVLGTTGEMRVNGSAVDVSKVAPEEVPALYEGHEVAGHGLWHSALDSVGTPAAMYEIIEDRRRLEQLTGRMVRSFAYPFGVYSEEVKEMLRLAGYESARTVMSAGDFGIPRDFLAWNPTCHHNDPDLDGLIRKFCGPAPLHAGPQLFMLWGHAYEFDERDNWDIIEKFASHVSGFSEEIWFATNGQIADYVSAYRSLRYSADASRILNLSGTDVYLESAGAVYRIPGGSEAEIPDPGI